MRLAAEPQSKYSIVLGLAMGVVALLAASIVPEKWSPIPHTAAMAGVFGLVAALSAAFINRNPSTIGMLIVAPITVLLLISILFTGILGFARHDLLFLAGVVVGAFAGAYFGTRLFRQTGRGA